MNPKALAVLCCPECHADLEIGSGELQDNEIATGTLLCRGGHQFPITGSVPRFAPSDSYANSFGLQWNAFRKTQLDSHSGLPISRERFFKESRWTPDELRGKRVLDIGCGAGRFSEVVLAAGAELVSLDYSSAVDACFANLGPHPRLTVVQGNVYHLPIKPGTFDYVYCFGVVQLTPDPHAAVLALVPPLKPGGQLAFDAYPRLLSNVLWPKYWLRPITRRMRTERLFTLIQSLVPKLLPVSTALSALPLLGRRLRYLVPVLDYHGVFPFTEEQHREWSVLDTFDMLASVYDYPQTAETIHRWLAESGLREYESAREGLVVGRGTK